MGLTNGTGIPDGARRWRRSSRCSAPLNSCVEVAEAPGGMHLRDSKDAASPVLTFGSKGWAAFVGGIASGAFGPAA